MAVRRFLDSVRNGEGLRIFVLPPRIGPVAKLHEYGQRADSMAGARGGLVARCPAILAPNSTILRGDPSPRRQVVFPASRRPISDYFEGDSPRPASGTRRVPLGARAELLLAVGVDPQRAGLAVHHLGADDDFLDAA